MKNFIEVTVLQHYRNKLQKSKRLISVDKIAWISETITGLKARDIVDEYAQSYIKLTTDGLYHCAETYNELCMRVRFATEPEPMFNISKNSGGSSCTI